METRQMPSALACPQAYLDSVNPSSFAAFPPSLVNFNQTNCDPLLANSQQTKLQKSPCSNGQEASAKPNGLFHLDLTMASQGTHPVLPHQPTMSADYFSLFLPSHQDPGGTSHLFADFASLDPSKDLAAPYFCAPSAPLLPPPTSSSSSCAVPTTSSASVSSSSASKALATSMPPSSSSVSSSSSSSSAMAKSQDRKRPYPCTMCQSRFGSKMELEEHQNSHTGMKPFQCDVCQSRFNRRSTLWNHKRIHSDAKPFKCTVCQMQFKWKNSLKCHKEMHLRKNELTQGAVPDTDSQLLTYATAAKKTMEMLGETPQPVATPAMALLPPSGTPSRLLTCAGTPRKRAPPKNGGGGRGSVGGGAGKANKNNGTNKEKRSVASGDSNSLGKAMATFGSGNLFPFEVGIVPEMAPRGKKEAKPATNVEVAALRREQALQQQQQPQPQHHATSATSAACPGFDLFRFPCGTEAHPSPSQTNGNDHIAAISGTQLGHGQQMFPFDAQTINHQQQQHLMDNNNLLMDPSLLLQDFHQFGHQQQQSIGARMVPMPSLLGLDLQQQLNSLATTGNPTQLPSNNNNGSESELGNQMSHSSSSVFPSSNGAVPCSSSSSTSSSNGAKQHNNNNFASPSSSSVSSNTEVLLSGYQFDPASMRFLAAAAEVQHQHQQHPVDHHVYPQQDVSSLHQPIDYGIFCMNGTMNGGTNPAQPAGDCSLDLEGQQHSQQQQQFNSTGNGQMCAFVPTPQQCQFVTGNDQQQQQRALINRPIKTETAADPMAMTPYFG